MKYILQFTIILLIALIGEAIKFLLPSIPIPGSIYGLCILLLMLYLKIIKVEQIQETALFLIEIMSIMFIPSAVGILTVWNQLAENIIPILIIVFTTTVIVMIVAGKVTDFLLGGEDYE